MIYLTIRKKFWIKSAIISLLVIIIVVCAIVKIIYLNIPGIKSADLILERDEEKLEKIIDYLQKNEISKFHIHSNNKTDIEKEVDDEEVQKALKKLFDKGYEYIERDGNTVSFYIWILWKDFAAGIAYSIDGVREPKIPYEIKKEPLSKEQWYYFVAE